MESEHRRERVRRPQSTQFGDFPAALKSLVSAVAFQAGRIGMPSKRRQALEALEAALRPRLTQSATRESFEETVALCFDFDYDRTESFLGFLYATMKRPLVAFCFGLLERLYLREDARVVAVDLVGSLFAELAEAMLEAEGDAGAAKRVPREKTVGWLYQAIRHDALDHCKSGLNRIERPVLPSQEEGYEQALDRLNRDSAPPRGRFDADFMEGEERRRAFLEAFERATSRLKARHREVLRLRELKNLSMEEIAVEIELTPRQVQDLLQYGREKRARLMASFFKTMPVFVDLVERGREVGVLLTRVQLGGLVAGMQREETLRQCRRTALY